MSKHVLTGLMKHSFSILTLKKGKNKKQDIILIHISTWISFINVCLLPRFAHMYTQLLAAVDVHWLLMLRVIHVGQTQYGDYNTLLQSIEF